MGNIFDRIALRIRTAVLIASVASLPFMFLFYVFMLRESFDALPLWAWIGGTLSHIMVWLGIGSLFDFQKEDRQHQPPER